jgi:hypothetical protein
MAQQFGRWRSSMQRLPSPMLALLRPGEPMSRLFGPALSAAACSDAACLATLVDGGTAAILAAPAHCSAPYSTAGPAVRVLSRMSSMRTAAAPTSTSRSSYGQAAVSPSIGHLRFATAARHAADPQQQQGLPGILPEDSFFGCFSISCSNRPGLQIVIIAPQQQPASDVHRRHQRGYRGKSGQVRRHRHDHRADRARHAIHGCGKCSTSKVLLHCSEQLWSHLMHRQDMPSLAHRRCWHGAVSTAAVDCRIAILAEGAQVLRANKLPHQPETPLQAIHNRLNCLHAMAATINTLSDWTNSAAYTCCFSRLVRSACQR